MTLYVPSFLPPPSHGRELEEKSQVSQTEQLMMREPREKEKGKSRYIDKFLEELKFEQELREKWNQERDEWHTDTSVDNTVIISGPDGAPVTSQSSELVVNAECFSVPLLFLSVSEYLVFYACQNELSSAVDDRLAISVFFMFACVIFNDMGQGSIEAVNEIVIYLVYLADGSFLASFMVSEYLLFYAGQNELSSLHFFSFPSSIFSHGDMVDTLLMILGFVGTIGDGFLASFMEGYCWSRTGEQQASWMRVPYLTAVLRQDVEYFDLNTGTSSEVITSITSDNLVIQDCLSKKVPNFIMNCATFVGCYARGFSMIWRLTLVGSPTAVLLVIPGILYGRILMELARKMRREYQKAGTVVEQCVSSIRTVYTFVEEERTIAKFSATLDDSVNLGHGVQKRGVRIPFQAGQLHISDFNLNVQVGRTMALVGGSGSGKSTVIALLERFYDLLVDKILLNGTDIKRLHKNSPIDLIYRFCSPSVSNHGDMVDTLLMILGFVGDGLAIPTFFMFPHVIFNDMGQGSIEAVNEIGLISQEPALFAISIKENILFGKEDATMEEVVAAAMAADAHNDGRKEWAVLKSPKIFQLDEATSTLDSESERIVQEALDHASVGRTVIVVAHLLSTICHVDVIAVVQDDHISEISSHDHLINLSDSLYSSLVSLYRTTTHLPEGETSSVTVQLGISSSVNSRFSAASPNSSDRSIALASPEENADDSTGMPRLPVPSFRRLLELNAPEWRQRYWAALVSAIQPTYSYVLGSITAFSSQEYILHMVEEAQAGPSREFLVRSYGGKLIADGIISAKALFQTFIILVSFGRIIGEAGSMTTNLAKGVDAIASVFAVLDRVTAIETNDSDDHYPERIVGDIEIHGVDFAYPARPDVVIL
ncbi:hypothetical protein ZIOFF_068650 [Zingiber officinale]|uniref:Uncharacterized protein n=1 Tax=Zingiber officinale TaxID=94328 RepID=A0A8J5C8I7_ZINOF|nr:hypothetical protein ZIOFF_068650 [Zingiber officinale]